MKTCLRLALLFLVPVSAEAQSSPDAAGGGERVLAVTPVRAGEHTIVYRRIAPPAVGERAQARAEESTAQADDPDALLSPGKTTAFFFCVATVGDGVSELRGTAAGREWHAVSTIDFRLLSGVTGFETEAVRYSLLVLVADAAGAAPATDEGAPLAPTFASGGRSEYVLVAGAEAAAFPEVVAALDALHAFHDAHRAQLVRDRLARVAELERREREWRENPPVARDTIVTFWPKRSRSYGHVEE